MKVGEGLVLSPGGIDVEPLQYLSFENNAGSKTLRSTLIELLFCQIIRSSKGIDVEFGSGVAVDASSVPRMSVTGVSLKFIGFLWASGKSGRGVKRLFARLRTKTLRVRFDKVILPGLIATLVTAIGVVFLLKISAASNQLCRYFR